MGRDNPRGRWQDGSVQVQAAPMGRPLRPQENDMINDKMLSYPESQGLLIDGFSRELKQAKEFEHIILTKVPENFLDGLRRPLRKGRDPQVKNHGPLCYKMGFLEAINSNRDWFLTNVERHRAVNGPT